MHGIGQCTCTSQALTGIATLKLKLAHLYVAVVRHVLPSSVPVFCTARAVALCPRLRAQKKNSFHFIFHLRTFADMIIFLILESYSPGLPTVKRAGCVWAIFKKHFSSHASF